VSYKCHTLTNIWGVMLAVNWIMVTTYHRLRVNRLLLILKVTTSPSCSLNGIFTTVLKLMNPSLVDVIYRFAVLTSSTYSRRCRRFGFHLITLRHTPQSVGLLWTRDRPVAETSTWQHKHSHETNIHSPGGIRTHDPSKRSAAGLRPRPRGHWDRQ
jgi:hypothetical protein